MNIRCKTLGLFMWNARIRIQKNMAYRVDFFIGLAISVANASVGPLLQYFIFTNTKGYPGWNLKQIILFQGMVLIFSGIRGLLFGNVGGNVSSMVWKGEFDRLLIMPFKPIKIILASGFDLSSIGVLLTGVALVIWAGITLKIKIFLLQILLVCMGIFCGLLFYLAFIVFYSTMMIMVIRVNRVEELINTLFNFAGYPAEIFSRFTRVILTTIFPFMIAAYFPSQVLLGRATIVIAPGIVACFLLFSLSILFYIDFIYGFIYDNRNVECADYLLIKSTSDNRNIKAIIIPRPSENIHKCTELYGFESFC